MASKKKNLTEAARIPSANVSNEELFKEGSPWHDNERTPDAKNARVRTGVPKEEKKRKPKKIFERDGNKCLRCGATEDLTTDHIVPVSKGGDKHDQNNKQTLCSECNYWKSNTTIDYREGIPVPDPINIKIENARPRLLKRSKVKKVYKYTVEVA